MEPGSPACRVLLVTVTAQRLGLLKACVRQCLPGCRIDAVDSYFEAMARATRLQADLLVLDLASDSVLVPALKRFLARAAPMAVVHVFDDGQDHAPELPAGADPPSLARLRQSLAALPCRRCSPH